MPVSTQPVPELQLPSSLVSHPKASVGSSGSSSLSNVLSSTSRQSQVAVGSAYKLSSDGRTVRRLKGIVPITTVGRSVTLINPTSQAPIQSFTLSPSDRPCTAPLTLLQSRPGGRSSRTTFFGVQSGTTSVSSQHPTRTEIWAFVEELSGKGKGTAEGSVRKEIVSIQGRVQLLQPIGDGRIVAFHADGSQSIVTRLDLDAGSSDTSSLSVSQTIKGTRAEQQHSLLYTSLIDPSSAQTLLAGTSQVDQEDLLALRLDARCALQPNQPHGQKNAGKKPKGRKSAMDVIDEAEGISQAPGFLPAGPVQLEVSAMLRPIDEANDHAIRIVSLGHLDLPDLDDASRLLDLQIHPDGRLVTLSRNGNLSTGVLSLEEHKLSLDAVQRFNVANLGQGSTHAHPAALLPLSRDHVLLVGVSASKDAAKADAKTSKGKVVGLIWDLKLEAVLAQIDWTLPHGSQKDSTFEWTITLSRCAGSLAIVQVEPATSKKADVAGPHPSLINVLAVPFTVPEESVLRHAVGKGELTRKWTQLDTDATPRTVPGEAKGSKKNSSSDNSALTAQQLALIDAVAKIAQGPAKNWPELDATFDKWLSEEKTRVAKETQEPSRKAKKVGSTEPSLGYNFVTALLPLILPESDKAGKAAYGRKALSYLLTRGAVSASMLSNAQAESSEGLLRRLRSLNDWENIVLAVRKVSDVSEADLISLLVDVLRMEQKRAPTPASGEAWCKPPSTIEFLSTLIKISVSRPLLRGTLKTQINNVDDVEVLLQILKLWLDASARMPLDQSTKSPKMKGAWAKLGKIPPIEVVLPFATDLLDTYFPLLLNSPSTHALLGDLSKTVETHLSGLNSLITLGGPLSAFAKLHEEQEIAERRAKAASKMNGLQNVAAGGVAASAGNVKVSGGGKGAAAARAETGGGIGITLGTAGATKTRRTVAMEESMLVGAYSLERLEI